MDQCLKSVTLCVLFTKRKHLLLQRSVQQKLIRCGNQIPENVMGKTDNLYYLIYFYLEKIVLQMYFIIHI